MNVDQSASVMPGMPACTPGPVFYHNPLTSEADVAGFIREGQPKIACDDDGLLLTNGMDPAAGQAANFLLWCQQIMPADFQLSCRFRPLREPGLAMLFFAASGRDGRDLFDPTLSPRSGVYRQYHDGDIEAYHLSFFRRKNPGERAFHTCNLRKSKGFHLVAQGADPIPPVVDCDRAYHIELTCFRGWVRFAIEGLPILQWFDDGSVGGPTLRGGHIGLRQMAPLQARWSDLTIRSLNA